MNKIICSDVKDVHESKEERDRKREVGPPANTEMDILEEKKAIGE